MNTTSDIQNRSTIFKMSDQPPPPPQPIVEGPQPIVEGSEAAAEAGHGRGDRSQYYDKWNKFTKESVGEIDAEEEEVKKATAVGADGEAVNESHKKDLDKRKALKEAKKLWDNVKIGEEKKKVVYENDSHKQDVVIDDDQSGQAVIVLKGNSDSSYTFPEKMKPVKLFVEDCKRCTITLHCGLITGTLEMTRCEEVKIRVLSLPINTIQVDLSQDIDIFYAHGLFADTSNSKVYHSQVQCLRVEYDSINNTKDTKEQLLDDHELCEAVIASDSSRSKKDIQFVTTFLQGDLITDLVVRDGAGHPTTMREIENRKQELTQAVVEKGLDINDPTVQKILNEYDPVTPVQEGRKWKDKGNEAFKVSEYMQASLHYTQSIDILEAVNFEEGAAQEVILAAYSNRAACALKLGDHAMALADSDSCLALEAGHVKATFRKGMALHALGRYREACPVLGKALEQQPKNEQIKTALRFAERRAMMP